MIDAGFSAIDPTETVNLTPTTLRPDYQAITDYFNGTITLAQFKANHGCQ